MIIGLASFLRSSPAAACAGRVIGKSDKIAAYPATRGYYPADLGATIYHALGVSNT